MDFFTSVTGVHMDAKTVEMLICAAVVMVILRLELFRRPGELARPQPADHYKKLLRECGPEALGTLACIALVALLRSRGDTIGADMDEGSRQAWESIKSQWPLLMTADTLLAIQVMLRLVVLLSVVVRAGAAAASPLLDEAAMLWLGGSVCRVACLYQSPAYWLEGPAGGMIPTAFEVAILSLVLVLGVRALWRSFLTAVLVSCLVAVFASRNYLNLAEEESANILFTAAHCFEFLASFVYVARTMFVENESVNKVNIAFTHLVMPLQQGLAVYFWLQAFEQDANLTGSGMGILAVQVSCLGQFGAYLGAAAIQAASWFDEQPRQAVAF